MNYTRSNSHYLFTDSKILQNINTLYYRLKKVDLDKTAEYSKIISIDRKGKTVVLSVFPNPSNGVFNIFGVKNTEPKSYTLINSIGQTIPIKVQNDQQLDFSVYPSGVYYLRVSSSGQVIRLVKE